MLFSGDQSAECAIQAYRPAFSGFSAELCVLTANVGRLRGAGVCLSRQIQAMSGGCRTHSSSGRKRDDADSASGAGGVGGTVRAAREQFALPVVLSGFSR